MADYLYCETRIGFREIDFKNFQEGNLEVWTAIEVVVNAQSMLEGTEMPQDADEVGINVISKYGRWGFFKQLVELAERIGLDYASYSPEAVGDNLEIQGRIGGIKFKDRFDTPQEAYNAWEGCNYIKLKREGLA